MELPTSGLSVCPTCGKSYKSKRDYNDHIDTHSDNEKVINCCSLVLDTEKVPENLNLKFCILLSSIMYV